MGVDLEQQLNIFNAIEDMMTVLSLGGAVNMKYLVASGNRD